MSPRPFQYIGPRAASGYRQFFVNGTRTRAETIYRYVVGPDGQTPEQVAADCDMPLEVVVECIEYCEQNRDLLQEEAAADWHDLAARGLAGDVKPVKAAS